MKKLSENVNYFDFESGDSRISLEDKATLSTTNSDNQQIPSQRNRASLSCYEGNNLKFLEGVQFKEKFSSDPFFRAKVNSFLKETSHMIY